MQFRLSTLFLLAVVLWSSLAVFAMDGIIAFAIVILLAVGIARSWPITFVPFVLVLTVLMLPAVAHAPCAARRVACCDNLRRIALALYNYHVANGSFPPAYVADSSGRPIHSWRVLILPFLDDPSAAALYKQYDFHEPWDGPNNKKLLDARPRVFACPADTFARPGHTTQTGYAAIVGPNAAWLGEKTRTPSDFGAAKNTTIMLVEVADAEINWTEPKDVSLTALVNSGADSRATTVSSMHGFRREFFCSYRSFSEVNIALVDGSAHVLPTGSLSPDVLPKCLTIGGCTQAALDASNDYCPPSWDEQRRLNWGNCIALGVWLASVGLLFYRAWRNRKIGREEAGSPGGTGVQGDDTDREPLAPG
jgi:hypothetical protein